MDDDQIKADFHVFLYLLAKLTSFLHKRCKQAHHILEQPHQDIALAIIRCNRLTYLQGFQEVFLADTYGGYARHGGGAFSGRDPTKVDRSAAYSHFGKKDFPWEQLDDSLLETLKELRC